MRVLELGTGLLPAYTGKILADQGCRITKITENDPILSMDGGASLWKYLNAGKSVLEQSLTRLDPIRISDVVFDNISPELFERLQIHPARLAERWGCSWISWRNSHQQHVGKISFHALYLAFQVFAAHEKRGQHIIIEEQQASAVDNPPLPEWWTVQFQNAFGVKAGL